MVGLLLGVCDPVGAAYIDEVLDDGPRGYWRLGETSGTTAFDAATSDGAQNGTYESGVTLGVAGALRNDSDTAAAFDGTIDEVALYPTPLSSQRIDAHHTAGIVPEPASATLLLLALSLLLRTRTGR
jgi:hypothetical protein